MLFLVKLLAAFGFMVALMMFGGLTIKGAMVGAVLFFIMLLMMKGKK